MSRKIYKHLVRTNQINRDDPTPKFKAPPRMLNFKQVQEKMRFYRYHYSLNTIEYDYQKANDFN